VLIDLHFRWIAEEINAGLKKVLNGLSKRKPLRNVAATATVKPSDAVRKPILIRSHAVAEDVREEKQYSYEDWSSEDQLR
jgi:hypothetical protein